ERGAVMRSSRRILVAALIAVAVAALVPREAPDAQAQSGPLVIGVLAPITGPFAAYAQDIVDGARLYAEEVGGPMSRRKIELVVEDYHVKPDVALTKMRKLAERDHAHVVVGIVLSAAALAVRDYVNAQKVPLVISGFAVAESLTLQPSPYVFRITYTGSMTG